MKDLDVMYSNIIVFAFDQVSTVQQGVEMLEAFDYLAKRNTIKTAVKKKANEILAFFIKELDYAKNEYDQYNMRKQKLQIPLSHGSHSGFAIWVRCLVARIESMKEAIDKLVFIEDMNKKEAYEKYDQVFQYLRTVIVKNKITDWREEANKELDENPQLQ